MTGSLRKRTPRYPLLEGGEEALLRFWGRRCRSPRWTGRRPAGGARRHQRNGPSRAASGQLDRVTVSEELAAVRRYPEPTERDARRCVGGGMHRLW